MSELVTLANRHARGEGVQPTRLAQMHIARATTRLGRVHAVQRPSLCFLAQGAKEVAVAGKTYRYTESEYLVSTVDLPVTGEIVEASARKPYLCLVIALEPSVVYEVLQDGQLDIPVAASQAGIFVGRGDPLLGDAVLRLARCLDDPRDCAVLASGILREIVYRLLRSRFGGMVRDLGVIGSRTQRIARAIEHLKNAFAERLRIDDLAELAGMSVSSFHEHFKCVTTLSPLQYQKQLRLQEARRLLAQGHGAAEAAFQVGYESPSQFSREYARCFGQPPSRDAQRHRS